MYFELTTIDVIKGQSRSARGDSVWYDGQDDAVEKEVSRTGESEP